MNKYHIFPIKLNSEFFYQFNNYLSKKQLEVHFNNHYLKYIENINIFVNENMDLCEKSIIGFNIDEINSTNGKIEYVISDRSKFLNKLSINSKNITAEHNINQAYFHELFFTSIIEESNSKI